MKLNLFKSLAIALPLVAVNLKKIAAEDAFFGNVSRVDLFEHIDFRVPTIRVELTDVDYKNLFWGYECFRDETPGFLKRNEHCFTAPYVDLNYATRRTFYDKEFIKMSAITNSTDLEIVQSTIDQKHNITLQEFESIITTYSNFTLEEIFSLPYKLALPSEKYFEAQDTAKMTFELDDEVKKFEKVKFKIGGRSTKFFAKLGYNINIKNGLLYGAKDLRLRPVVVDPSFLRDKLAYDLHNKIELPCISANYARLYINDTFMGLYLLRDAYKAQWVENTFGEKSTKHLYTCSNDYKDKGNDFFKCVNDDEDITEDEDMKIFLKKLENSKDRKDLEEFFDVKSFIRLQAARYLFGSFDHVTGENNNMLYMYHDVSSGRDLWIPLIYDFDMNFGNFRKPSTNRTFDEEIFEKKNPLYTMLNLNNNSEELISIMDEIMRTSFNPNILLPRIDQLRTFIEPYVKEDRTPGENGLFPGRFNIGVGRAHDSFTYEDFLTNTEFTTIKARRYINDFTDKYEEDTCLGLKQWVIERFKFACSYYKLDCSYADAILNSPYGSGYELKETVRSRKNEGCKGTGYGCCVFKNTIVETVDESGKWGHEGNEWCLVVLEEEEEPIYDENCWSLADGYPCCRKETTKIEYVSKSSGKEWGLENGDWCGITDRQRNRQKTCPINESYSCCKKCDVIYTDEYKWGVEGGDWCIIPYSCDPQQEEKKEDESKKVEEEKKDEGKKAEEKKDEKKPEEKKPDEKKPEEKKDEKKN
ncbi:coth-domain-containing protein [Neocallimastix lanati (nom. inval.)]|nr:coth-domain-containing protein [Neocallimastix sp. JGI-2020a]